MIVHEEDAALASRVRSQYGGGAFVYASTLVVANGSSIDDNTASVSSPAFALTSGLVVGSRDNQSRFHVAKRDFAMIEHEGDAALARASTRRSEEAPSWTIFPP